MNPADDGPDGPMPGDLMPAAAAEAAAGLPPLPPLMPPPNLVLPPKDLFHHFDAVTGVTGGEHKQP